MFFKSHRKLKIGELAKLHGINKKTLMWYDEVGLLKPAQITPSGYRAYTFRESFLLDLILMLRRLSLPIPKIKDFLKKRTPADLKLLCEAGLKEVDAELLRLARLKEQLEVQKSRAEELLDLDAESISVVYEREPRFLRLIAPEQISSMEDLLAAMHQDHDGTPLFEHRYGAMIAAAHLADWSYEKYLGYYIESSEPADFVKRPGFYLKAYSRGAWEGLAARYRELLDYAAAHQLKPTGFAYETGLNEPFIDHMADYLTEIVIELEPPAHLQEQIQRESSG